MVFKGVEKDCFAKDQKSIPIESTANDQYQTTRMEEQSFHTNQRGYNPKAFGISDERIRFEITLGPI